MLLLSSSSSSSFQLDIFIVLERHLFFFCLLSRTHKNSFISSFLSCLNRKCWFQSRLSNRKMKMYQTNINQNIAPKQYIKRLNTHHQQSRPLRCRYSSTPPRANDESEWLEYKVGDLLELVAVNDGEGKGNGEKMYFEVVEKFINDKIDDSDVSFNGYIDGLEYQLDVSKPLKEARLHTREGKDEFVSSVPEELLTFCPEFGILHKELVRTNKYPVVDNNRHKQTIQVDWVKHEKITDLTELKTKASENPDFWSLGTTPSQPPLSTIERLTLNAGEIYALLAGNRPLALIQLYAPFVEDGRVQPIDCPFVKRALKELVTTSPQIFSCVACHIEGSTTLSAVFYPNISPNKERAALLASFGAQGALVAQSPYYGVLIGECLGYTRENIYHHVKNTCNLRGDISKAVLDQVALDLLECSPVEPLQRWRNGYDDDALNLTANGNRRKRRRKKKSSAVSSPSVEALEAFLGKKR